MANTSKPASSPVAPSLPEGVTQAQVNTWKHQYGRVHIITVDFDGQPLHAVVRRPDLKMISAAASVMKDDPIKAGIVLYENCKLAVDPVIDTNDELKLSVTKVVGTLFQTYQTTLGEL